MCFKYQTFKEIYSFTNRVLSIFLGSKYKWFLQLFVKLLKEVLIKIFYFSILIVLYCEIEILIYWPKKNSISLERLHNDAFSLDKFNKTKNQIYQQIKTNSSTQWVVNEIEKIDLLAGFHLFFFWLEDCLKLFETFWDGLRLFLKRV